ncbi:glycerol-3-phosphate dehydrogenase/oxidase [Streptomyces sp. B8F3]|uniref:glycerol-3-phosphate dehydrogenase/oxidase n=1 Tax=unclassified Streptomyces TaxID=2593676 RepID=UPI00325D14AB
MTVQPAGQPTDQKAASGDDAPRDFSLNAPRRARELAGLAAGERVDLLVVGLGATGAGVALDAAARGLSVAAIDAQDLAFGTSRWSSKLIHGGLRYLASGQVGIARECAVERGALLEHIAPHLVHAQPFVIPLTPLTTRTQAAVAWAGLRSGDLLRAAARTSRAALPPPRRLSAVETGQLVPGLRRYGLRGGLLSWDGQLTDDARLVTAVARTAAGHGARVLTRARAVELTGSGAVVRDETTGERLRIRARAVVNAAGVWAGSLVPGVRLRPSRGTHLVLRAEALGMGRQPGGAGVHIPIPGATGRFALVLPQDDGRVYVGLTDEPVDDEVPDVPAAPETDVGFLLDVLDSALDVPVRRSDVVGAFAGLRPLLESDGSTADLSRRHAILTSPDGVVTVVGGKLTTYRRMAEDAVDAAVSCAGLTAGPCRTARLPLVGAAPAAELAGLDAPRRLVQRYGTEAPAVQALAAAEPALAAPVVPGYPVTGAELVWAVRHEGALDEGDLLDRRTRLGLVTAERAAAVAAAREVLSAVPQAVRPGR